MARRILIVDDEPAIRFAVCEYFMAYGYVVDCAQDTATGTTQLSRRTYDAVIADLRLGGSEPRGGLEIIQLAKRLPGLPCVVLLSAEHSPELVREAKACGANFVLHKPLPLFELKGRIAEYLQWRESCKTDEEFRPGNFAPTLPGGGSR